MGIANERKQFNPSMLSLVRESKGLSQAALATIADLGIKQAAISKYESGVLQPPEETVQRLATYFGYLPSFFYRAQEDITEGLIYHRKRSALTATERGRVEAEAKLRALDALVLCENNRLRSDVLKRNGRTAREMADAIRDHWGVPDGPIENVTALLEAHGIVVIEFDFKTVLLDGFFLAMSEQVIFLAINSNAAIAPDRRRFSILHELGHALLAEKMFPGKEAEDEANEFAAEFLAPGKDISPALKAPISLQSLYKLKMKWGMSMAALLRRARDVKQYSDSQYRRACIFMASKGFRKSEPSCGVKNETATLFTSLLSNLVASVAAPWEKLDMLPETFDRRYGSLLKNQ